MNRLIRQRHLQLATTAGTEHATRIAALPGVNRAMIERNNMLTLVYDLRDTELAVLLQHAEAFGLRFSPAPATRLQRWLQCWRDYNRRRHLYASKGWQHYLHAAYLGSAARQDSLAVRPERWRRYLTKKPATDKGSP